MSEITQDHLDRFSLIVSSSSGRVITRQMIERIRSNALIMDLCSPPGSVDFDAAKALGRRVVWARAQAGTAPRTAGADEWHRANAVRARADTESRSGVTGSLAIRRADSERWHSAFPGEGMAMMTQDTDNVLQAQGVYKVFIARGGKANTALRNVELTVRRGEFVCLIGPSGCGKSTVLNMFAGLVAPSDGQIFHDGRVVSDVNTRVGYVTQDDNLLPWRSAVANVELVLECKGVPRGERRERAMDYLARVGLKGREDLYPHELSGGMRKRVSIVRTLVDESVDVILDGRAFRAARCADTADPAGRAAQIVAGDRPYDRFRYTRYCRGDCTQ